MKSLLFAARWLIVSLTVVGLTLPLAAGELVPFQGRLEGSYSVTINPGPPPVGTFQGAGRGVATQLGQFTYEFPHTVSFGTTPPLGVGTYAFTAANGDRLVATFQGQSAPVAPGVIYVVETCVIVEGTGRFADAQGEFVVERLVDQVNRTTVGSFRGAIKTP